MRGRSLSGEVLVCPKCRFRFSKSYARITACRGCTLSVSSCSSIKCPRCEHEFPLR